LSFSELETLCDISRRYVALGLDVLEPRQLVSIEKVGSANRYRLATSTSSCVCARCGQRLAPLNGSFA
jgi:hypothetical protein